MESNILEIYWQYLNQICPTLDFHRLLGLVGDVEKSNWDEPESA